MRYLVQYAAKNTFDEPIGVWETSECCNDYGAFCDINLAYRGLESDEHTYPGLLYRVIEVPS